MSGQAAKLLSNVLPFVAAVGALHHFGVLKTQPHPTQHYYQQMRKEADKQWPSGNKKLDYMLGLAHGT